MTGTELLTTDQNTVFVESKTTTPAAQLNFPEDCDNPANACD